MHLFNAHRGLWGRWAVAGMEGEVNLSSSTGKKQPEEWNCLSGLGWSTASSLAPEGKAVPALTVLILFGWEAAETAQGYVCKPLAL